MSLYIRKAGHKGRGVFTDTKIAKGSIVEVCPVIHLSTSDVKKIRNTRLENYWFSWSRKLISGNCMVLGYGMIYNHSHHPNCDFRSRMKKREMVYFAIKDIPAKSELLIHYGCRLWFDTEKKRRKKSTAVKRSS
jgi:uncharacterized protein